MLQSTCISNSTRCYQVLERSLQFHERYSPPEFVRENIHQWLELCNMFEARTAACVFIEKRARLRDTDNKTRATPRSTYRALRPTPMQATAHCAGRMPRVQKPPVIVSLRLTPAAAAALWRPNRARDHRHASALVVQSERLLDVLRARVSARVRTLVARCVNLHARGAPRAPS